MLREAGSNRRCQCALEDSRQEYGNGRHLRLRKVFVMIYVIGEFAVQITDKKVMSKSRKDSCRLSEPFIRMHWRTCPQIKTL